MAKTESSMEEIRVGDIVMCVEYPGNPCGIVVKQYRPTHADSRQ